MTVDCRYSSAQPLVAAQLVSGWLADIGQPVAVTGGTGFVGSHLVDTLCAAGLRPRTLVRDPSLQGWTSAAPIDVIAGALDDADALERLVEGVGTVFHIAGRVRARRAVDFDRVNREGTGRLVAAVTARAPSARLVLVASQAALGPSPGRDGLGPDAPPAPVSDYGRSKRAGESLVLSSALSWSIVRPSAVYGPRDVDVLEFFRMASRGLVAIPSGERWITIAWVGDVVRAIVAAAAAQPGRVWHVGSLQPLRLEDMARELAAAGGIEARVIGVPALAVRAAGAVAALASGLGWAPSAVTRDKLRELLAKHWSLETAASRDSLGLNRLESFDTGARTCWKWYRDMGWLA
jgi:nucleoside-diphosphate-sugar epimerase